MGYVGAAGLIYKFKTVLTWAQLFYNNVHEHFRNRVEQIVSVVKAHRLFRPHCYRGSYRHLGPLVTIVGHATALELRFRQRFDTIGSWWHAY